MDAWCSTVLGSFDAIPVPVHIDRTLVATSLEIGLAVTGSFLLWHLALSPAARARRPPNLLQPWRGSGSDLLLFLLFVFGGVLLSVRIMPLLLRAAGLGPNAGLVAMEAAFEAGLLLGIAVFHFGRQRLGNGLPLEPLRTLSDGATVFLVVLPIVYAAGFLWRGMMLAGGLPVKNQDSLEAFANLHSWILRAAFSVLAIVIAPLTEELIFRAGLFRFLRGRVPLWIAVLVPAGLFAGAHLLQNPLENLPTFGPLIALAAVFSIAYNRTGRIGVTIVAHALFNLNTVLLVLAGVNT
jgi:membrane protease YdiL (CAAX protease family)